MAYYAKRPTHDDYNRLVNQKWRGVPPEQRVPQSDIEAQRGFKRLYRKATGRKFRGTIKMTSGNRHTWCRRGVWSINRDRSSWFHTGWPEIIHGLAHWVERHHTNEQLRLERDLTDYALRLGFHEGKLAPKPQPEKSETDLLQIEVQKLDRRIEAAEDRMKKAKAAIKRNQTILTKVRRQKRTLEKKIPAFQLD